MVLLDVLQNLVIPSMDNVSIWQLVVSCLALLSPCLTWALNARITNTLLEFREKMKGEADKAYVNAPIYTMQLQAFETRFQALEKEQAVQRERYHELASNKMAEQYRTQLLEEIRDELRERHELRERRS